MVEKGTRDRGDGILTPARVEPGDSLCGVDFFDGIEEGVVEVRVGRFGTATLGLETGYDEVELRLVEVRGRGRGGTG